MLNLLVDFDTTVVIFVERRCQTIQRWLGLTNFFWWKLLVLGAFGLYLYLTIFAMIISKPIPDALMIFLIILGILSFWGCNWWERRSLARLREGHANPLKVDLLAISFRWVIYCTFLFLLFRAHPDNWRNVLLSLVVIHIPITLIAILPACDPLPPTKSKIRQWFASLTTRVRSA